MAGRKDKRTKVVVIGTGMVGSTFAYSLMINGVASEIVLIDANEERAASEVADLNHGLPFVRPAVIRTGEYADCADADVIVITAGAAQRPGETRLDLVGRNVKIFEDIIPRIVASGTHGVLVIASNPVDVMTYVTYKISGFPANQVIGSGTVLDTSRFRYLLSRHCGVDPSNVHAYIIGEHGDSEVAVWSLANIAGLRFSEYCPICGHDCGPLRKEDIFEQVRTAAYPIIKAKGATYYAIGLALVQIVETILRDEHSVLTVSSLLQGEYGLENVCLSLPSLVNRHGVAKKLLISLNEKEEEGLRNSARVLQEVIKAVGY
ncbi:MAG TPA: L-lactate dehydrogenase [Firmicutes bacterium]|jgi:L-lactate dehydrogenase|nr:L-lactate dehydrogenase [Bacillota bacterium]HOQ23888.1 L-lactate dehydrogenase [Bacillota bacterium]HPT67139.1 L-lactate dehydrogenase [Bacillota bacterium]